MGLRARPGSDGYRNTSIRIPTVKKNIAESLTMDGGAVIALIQAIWGGVNSIRLAKHEINVARNRFEDLLTYTKDVRASRDQLSVDLREEPETLADLDRALTDAEYLCDIYRSLLMEKSGKGGRSKPITPKRQQADVDIPLKELVLWVLKSREIFRLYEGQSTPDTVQSLRNWKENLRGRMNDCNRRAGEMQRDGAERLRRNREIARFIGLLLFTTELPRVVVEDYQVEVGGVDGDLNAADGLPMKMTTAMWLRMNFLAKEEGSGVGKVLSSQ